MCLPIREWIHISIYTYTGLAPTMYVKPYQLDSLLSDQQQPQHMSSFQAEILKIQSQLRVQGEYTGALTFQNLAAEGREETWRTNIFAGHVPRIRTDHPAPQRHRQPAA